MSSSFPISRIGFPFGFSSDLLSIRPSVRTPENRGSDDDDRDSGSTPPWLGGGGGAPTTPAQWTFPQYSQTWAFTPPAPPPYMATPAFDPKSDTGYYVPKTGTSSKSKTPTLQDIWAKYR